MKDKILNEVFIEAVKEEVTDSKKLASVLMSILNIEKEAIYRRLRNEVPFTFSEIVDICRALSISIDKIAALDAMSTPYQFQMIDYVYPDKNNYLKIENYINLLTHVVSEPFSELAEVTNSIPELLFLNHKYITKFYIFNWDYHYHFASKPIKYFHEIEIEDKLYELQKLHYVKTKEIQCSYFIWDMNIFKNLVDNLKIYANLTYISKEDIKNIKQDLFDFLDYIEDVAIKGCYPETGKRVLIYLSDFSIDTNYSYLESTTHKLSLFKVFSMNSMSSIRENSFTTMKNWVDSYKRFSTLISVSGEKARRLFFDKQRKIISTL